MIFYLLKNQITTLFIKLGLLTSLSFSSPITSFIFGGKDEDIYLKVVNEGKTLVIRPNHNQINSNLIIMTEKEKYYFNLKSTKNNPHKFIEIKKGRINTNYKLSFENKNLKIFVGGTSVMAINKLKRSILINERKVKLKGYFSKGIPIIISGKRIFN